jgi:hypothetical protein
VPKRRHKPTDPQELQHRRAVQIETAAEVARLRAAGVVVRLDPARRIVAAYRSSAFHKLTETKTITAMQAAAAEQLCRDWAVWKGLDGGPERTLTPASGPRRPDLVTDRMLAAGDRVARALRSVGPMDRDLLAALVQTTVEADVPLPWRDVVRRVTGVTQTVRQSQMIYAALENLCRA